METINLDDYEIFPAIYFASRTKPTIIITADSVLLNKAALKKLEDAEYVQFMLNEKDKTILVKTCNKNDEAATIFKTSGDNPKKIKHIALTKRLFEITKWNTTKKYRAVGYHKKYIDCDAIYFDISAVKELPLKQSRITNVKNKKNAEGVIRKF